MPPKSGRVGKNTSFGGILQHMPDDFNYPKIVATKELEEHKATLIKL